MMALIYSTYFTKKVVLINFVATMLIVILHALPPLRFGYPLDRSQPFYYFIMVVCQLGVPVFFFLSGLLFYKRCSSHADIKKKLKNRVKSLFIPYLLWNTIFVLLYFVMTRWELTGNIMKMGSAVNSLRDVVIGILDARFTPLWFVKILMIYSLLSPLIYFCLRRRTLFAIILIGSIIVAIFCKWDKYDSVLLWLPMYLCGCAMGYYKLAMVKSKIAIIFFSCLLISLIILSYYYTGAILLLRIVAPIVIWVLVDWLLEKTITEHFKVKEWMTCTFFIYCTHYFALNVFQKIGYLILGSTQSVMFTTFIISLIMTIFTLIFVARSLSGWKIYKVLTGGR